MSISKSVLGFFEAEVSTVEESIDFKAVASAIEALTKKFDKEDHAALKKAAGFVFDIFKNSDVNKQGAALKSLSKHLDSMDSYPRDAVLEILDKHGMLKGGRLVLEGVLREGKSEAHGQDTSESVISDKPDPKADKQFLSLIARVIEPLASKAELQNVANDVWHGGYGRGISSDAMEKAQKLIRAAQKAAKFDVQPEYVLDVISKGRAVVQFGEPEDYGRLPNVQVFDTEEKAKRFVKDLERKGYLAPSW